MKKELREKAELVAQKKGFSSLQDVMRLFLAKFADNKIDVGFTEPPIYISKRGAARYDRMTRDFEDGKVTSKQFTSVKELIDDLNA